MAQEVGSLYYDLSIDDRQLDRQLGQADRKVESFGDRISQHWDKSVKGSKLLAASLLGIGAIGAGIIGKFVVMGGFSRALGIDDAKGKLKGLGYGLKAIEKITNSTLEAVRGTAFSLDQAMTVAASSLASGIKPGQELTKYLRGVADAATIAGADLNEMGSIFNKVQANGRMMTEELNQLQDRGLPILSWLAKDFGVTAEAMREMVSDGAVDAARFRKVIEKNIGGAALESGQTVRGAWANLQAAMARVGAAVADKILPKLRDAFMGLTKFFDDNKDAVVAWAERVGGGFKEALDWLNRLENKDLIIKAIAGAISAMLLPAVIDLAKSMIDLVATMGPWAALGIAIVLLANHLGIGFDDVKNALSGVISFVRAAAVPVWNTLLAVFNFLLPPLKALWKTIQTELWPSLRNLWAVIGPDLIPALKVLAVVVGVVIIGALWAFINVLRIVISWVSRFVNGLAIVAKAGIAVFKGIANALIAPYRHAFNTIATMWNRTVGSLKFKAPDWVPGMGGKGWNMPIIPTFADGVRNFRGGLAIVGERGPELVELPSGSNVRTNEELRGMGDTIVNIGTIEDRQDADYVIRRLDRSQRLEKMGLSPL